MSPNNIGQRVDDEDDEKEIDEFDYNDQQYYINKQDNEEDGGVEGRESSSSSEDEGGCEPRTPLKQVENPEALEDQEAAPLLTSPKSALKKPSSQSISTAS
jgi:hypothetical protein